MRQIILDTETTGLRVEDGHRIIEVGCVEMISRKLTGKYFHQYINPEREVEAGAVAVHGITNEFLSDKPIFRSIVDEMMAFIDNAELIIHNAPFDLSFLNYELMISGRGWKALTDYCSVIDTLPLARKLHVGQRNSLDALCKRYGIDNSKRDVHGALLDANLLAQVYLAMTGGQGSFFDGSGDASATHERRKDGTTQMLIKKHKLVVLRASDEEKSEHEKYLDFLSKKGTCQWREPQDIE